MQEYRVYILGPDGHIENRVDLICGDEATAKEWNESLRCPICGKTGMASLRHEDDSEKPTVQSAPDGFKVVVTKHGPTSCLTCTNRH
jgi:hypothetical protein